MADFAYNPDFGYTATSNYTVLRNKFENGTEQRRLVHNRKLRKYQLPFTNRTNTEIDAVIDFFDDQFGSLEAFTISIDGENVLGVIVEDSFEHVRTGPNSWNYSFTFEEVIS